MTAVGVEMARLVIDAARIDDALAADLAAVLRPHLERGEPAAGGWMSLNSAADYLDLTVNALHKLTADRKIPFEQEAPGGKCWFNRSDLDTWRRGRSQPGWSSS